VLYSHRKFYFGGKGILLRSNGKEIISYVNKDNVFNLKTKIKNIIGQHTNTDILKKKLSKRYRKCRDLFSVYTDDGFIMNEDSVPLGIPLKLNKKIDIASIDSNDLGECYIWPNYIDDAKERNNKRNVLVISIHNMESYFKVKRLITLLKQEGILLENTYSK
jgi:hypothetical protein